MSLDELKAVLKLPETTDLDITLFTYQLAAEAYLAGAGVAKNYDNALYKMVVTIIVGLLLENPTLFVTGTVGTDVKGISLNGFIAQLRLSQGATS